MSRRQPSHSPDDTSSRFVDAQPIATLTLAALTVATVVSMCRIFPDWAFLRPMVTVVLGTHLLAFTLRVLRVPGWIAVPALAGLMLAVLGVVYYRDSTAGLLPTGDTIDQLRSDLRLVWQQFPHAVAPVPSEGSFASSIALLLACCAAFADLFAFRAFGRAEALVPTGIVFIFTSALGTVRSQVPVSALWIGAALLALAMLQTSHDHGEGAWMGARRQSLAAVVPATFACATIAALGAGLVAPRLPGAGDAALIDARNRGDGVTQVLSPLVDIRSRLVNLGNLELFTVSADRPAYWRAITLTEFDGTVWTPPSQDLEPAIGPLEGSAVVGSLLAHTVTISGLGGNLVPAAASPVEVGTTGLYWAAGTQTLIFPGDGLVSGDSISVLSAQVDPDPTLLRQATADSPPDPSTMLPPRGLSDEAAQLARDVTATATTRYDQALLLQNFFRTEFTYDLTVQSGHGSDAIQNFLRIRRGYCEQFSGTYAAMARSLGLPARVAVGFTPGDLQADGLYHVYGRYAHAWPEVWFDDIGWVSFEPTPGRGAPGAEGHTGVAPGQETGTGGAGTGEPVAPAPQAGDGNVEPDGPQPGDTVSTPELPPVSGNATANSKTSNGSNLLVRVVLGALVLLLAWMALMPLVVRRWTHHRPHTARDRVVTAWQQTCGALRLAGAPPLAGATPLEYANTAESATGIDHRLLGEVARLVTKAVYSPVDIDDTTARRCEHLRGEIDELCRERQPIATRVLARLDPRVARLRSAG